MTNDRRALLHSLNTLVDLREREVDRLSAEMARKEEVRQRFHRNLARMHGLAAGASAQGTVPAALSANRADYKQALLRMVEQHRQDLSLHEADMAAMQRALAAASRKQEVLEQVRSGEARELQASQARQEQKQQDELASQVWWRTRP